MNLIIKLALGQVPTENDIEHELYEICDRVHANCDNECPVYDLNNGIPDTAKNFDVNRGCDCFKNGAAMRKFIKNKYI